MESSKNFQRTIEKYLEKRAQTDELFAIHLGKDGKSIEDCCTYILNEVKKSECNGFTDNEIYSMAVHYYLEDNIDPGKPIDCKVVVNHTVKPEEGEKKTETHKLSIPKTNPAAEYQPGSTPKIESYRGRKNRDVAMSKNEDGQLTLF